MLNEALAISLLVGFATASLSRLLTRETGPFGLFVRIRNAFPQGSFVWEVVNCPLCSSPYLAGAISVIAILAFAMAWWLWFLIVPAAIGVAYASLGLAAMIR